MANHRLPIEAGQRYNKLTVVRRVQNHPKDGTQWLCRCDCGGERVVCGSSLVSNNTRSCGCISRERLKALHARMTTHGHSRQGQRSPTFISYWSMIGRCHNENDPSFREYGGRGISVTKPWRDSFAAFLHDMGERPANTSIDRIDGRFGYFAANCRWASPSQQARNRKPRNVPWR